MSVEFATQVVQQLVRGGYTAYWAGGCVRDLLRGAAPQDYDVATSATPEQVRTLFGERRSLAVGESFGVVIVLGRKGAGESVEVATFRREGEYVDGRRPSSVQFCSAEEDAGRRDFTINGMFFDPLTQTVHDYVGGQADLNRKLVRAIGDPRARMMEDKLRMLRAVRFAAALDFELDETTARAISSMAEEIQVISAERIAQELRKMLAGRQRARAMQLCIDLGLMRAVLPEVQQCTLKISPARWQQRRELLEELGEASFESGFAALLRDVPAPATRVLPGEETSGTVHRICRRLRLSNAETERICQLSEHRGQLHRLPGCSLAEIKRLAVQPFFNDLLQLERTAANVAGESLAPFEWIDRFLQNTSARELDPPALVTGTDLLSLGMKSSPQFKHWLTAIRNAQLNNDISTKEQALALARQLAMTSANK